MSPGLDKLVDTGHRYVLPWSCQDQGEMKTKDALAETPGFFFTRAERTSFWPGAAVSRRDAVGRGPGGDLQGCGPFLLPGGRRNNNRPGSFLAAPVVHAEVLAVVIASRSSAHLLHLYHQELS